MASDEKLDEIIRLIAVKHGIAVGRDDPILVLHTINEHLARESASAHEALLSSFKSELEAIAHRWGEDAKDKAERTLTVAITTSRDIMSRSMQDGAVAAAAAIRRELEAASGQLTARIQEARRVAVMNLVAAVIATGAAALALWATRFSG